MSNPKINEEMKIEKVKLSQIKPYWRNARKNDKTVELVKKSIQKYGFNVPLVVDTKYVIITGHARYKALMQLGREFAYCVVKDYSEQEAKEYRIIDNKTQEATTWIEEDLYVELRELDPLVMQDFFLDIDLKTINSGSVIGYKGVTEEDVENAKDKLGGHFSGMVSDDADRKVSVMCPHCSEEFFINKEDLKPNGRN